MRVVAAPLSWSGTGPIAATATAPSSSRTTANCRGRGQFSVMSDTFRKIKDRPILWTDADGVVHRCEGADVHPGVRLLWTGCNRDVPAGNAYLPGARDGVTCPTCISVMP